MAVVPIVTFLPTFVTCNICHPLLLKTAFTLLQLISGGKDFKYFKTASCAFPRALWFHYATVAILSNVRIPIEIINLSQPSKVGMSSINESLACSL